MFPLILLTESGFYCWLSRELGLWAVWWNPEYEVILTPFRCFNMCYYCFPFPSIYSSSFLPFISSPPHFCFHPRVCMQRPRLEWVHNKDSRILFVNCPWYIPYRELKWHESGGAGPETLEPFTWGQQTEDCNWWEESLVTLMLCCWDGYGRCYEENTELTNSPLIVI